MKRKIKLFVLFALTGLLALSTSCKDDHDTVSVSQITLQPTSYTLFEGESFVITATVLPSDADNKTVKWSTSDASVANVDNAGKVTGEKAGIATITATTEDGNKTATCAVTVNKKIVSVTGITLTPASLTLAEGETFTITATVLPSDAANKTVKWTTSDASVAGVDSTGKVTGEKAGTATIIATSEDGNKSAACAVTVKKKVVSVTGITLTPTSRTLAEGETFTVTATVIPADATDKRVKWTTSDAAVAIVDNAGKVIGEKAGTATITATTEDGNKSAACAVTVKKKVVSVTGITLTPTSRTLAEGETFTITATVIPADATDKRVKWTTSDAAVAVVDSAGKVTGEKAGTATITATTEDGNKTATCAITVNKKIVSVTGITLTPTSRTIIEGETFTITATVLPSDATNKTVKWTTSDASVVGVDNEGKVTGEKAGIATITATTEDGNKIATCAITVIKPVAEDNFVLIPAGTFTMGSPETEVDRNTNEIEHQVTVSAFKMSKYAVTFAEYDVFCEATGRTKPSDEGWGRGSRPVINVTWNDANAYATWLSQKSGKTYRLPTEAEWEYACRAGTTTPFSTGNCLSNVQANYDWRYPYGSCPKAGGWPEKTMPVGSYPPNPFGLYDMHGNVVEWCNDWYGTYPDSNVTDPTGPGNGSYRVIRGGNWAGNAHYCRSARRRYYNPGLNNAYTGFRLVSSL